MWLFSQRDRHRQCILRGWRDVQLRPPWLLPFHLLVKRPAPHDKSYSPVRCAFGSRQGTGASVGIRPPPPTSRGNTGSWPIMRDLLSF